ncbi:MAG: hypothetical protein DRO18_07510 [Thermoprotei archaeon]|nr:MAG: hypothetical protein DRO18_07510 [Thermoprotei archaeon]
MESKKVFISGRPGVGKTTVFLRVIDELRRRGYSIGGIICPEIRVRGRRIGFDIIDIASNRKGKLARLCELVSNPYSLPRVGRYCVIVNEAEDVGVRALSNALDGADVIGIDEVGPMELKVPKLKDLINRVLLSNKPLVAVVHRSLASAYASRYKALLFWVNEHNRGYLHERILKVFITP